MIRPGSASVLDDLGAGHPEWRAWLDLYREVRAALDDAAWAAAVPATPTLAPGAPLVAGTVLQIDGGAARRLVAALMRRVHLAPGAAPPGTDESLRLLEAAVNEDGPALHGLAAARAVDAGLLAEMGVLAAMPLLQACRRAWEDRIPPDWLAAACPVCGAWATLTEARGVERALRQRCGRCGADWAAQPVRCPFCANVDHTTLGSLRSEDAGDRRTADTCDRCLGYVKTLAVLHALSPADVRLLDLDSVDLDVAALERGYARPARPAHGLGVRVVASPRGRWGAWRRR